MAKNILFFKILANKLILVVLALKQLNIPMKINSPKKAVIKYLSATSVRKNCLKKGTFKNKTQSNEE